MSTKSRPNRQSYRYEIRTEFNSGSISVDPFDEVVSWSDTVTGIDNPMWRSQVKRHVTAGTPMDAQLRRYSRGTVLSHYDYGPVKPYNRVTVDGQVFDVVFPSSGFVDAAQVDSVRKVASLRFILKCQRARQNLQALVSLGEYGETLRMLRRPAQALWNGLFSYLSSARRRVRKVKKKHRRHALHDYWLEYNYGWAPLVSDIEGAVATLREQPDFKFAKVNAGHTANFASSCSTGSSTVEKLVFRYEQQDSIDVSVRCYGEVKVALGSPAGYLSRWGLEAEQFIPTVWELIPYSFVADYFSNIGDILQANSLPKGTLAWSGMTSRSSYSRKRNYTFNETGTKANVSQYKGGGGYASPTTAARVNYFRQTAVYQSFGFSDFAFEIPGVSRKWINLAALARANSGGARL
jgi:hypothetical protein